MGVDACPPAAVAVFEIGDEQAVLGSEAVVRHSIAGTPQTVRRRIEQLADRTGAVELLATTSTYDRAALAASDAALARIITG